MPERTAARTARILLIRVGIVTFTAIPENGWEFSAWEGGAGCPPFDWECVLTANDDLRVTAFFSPAPQIAYASDPSDESGGRVTITGADGVADGKEFAYSGGMVTFTAIPENGWEISAWEGGAGCPPADWECALAANGDLRVTARFSPAPRIAYASDPSDESRGRVTIAGADGVADDEEFVYSGGTVTFTAIPADRWERSAWTGDCAGVAGNPCAVVATLDVSVGATFTDIDECAIDTDNCAADGGRCDNIEGGFACGCVAGYSGDGRTCDADKTGLFPAARQRDAFRRGRGGRHPERRHGDARDDDNFHRRAGLRLSIFRLVRRLRRGFVLRSRRDAACQRGRDFHGH